MSADNWTTCPKCKTDWDKNQDKAAGDLAKAYGKVSQSEYAELKETLLNPVKLEASLREDYELGVIKTKTPGVFQFYIIYGGSCATCGFNFTYRHEEQVFPIPEVTHSATPARR